MSSSIVIETADGAGRQEYAHAKGLLYPKATEERLPNKNLATHVENIGNLEIRKDDIFLATFPKSGTHWCWEIVMMLQKGEAEYEKNVKEFAFLDFRDTGHLSEIPSPRVLNCHYPVKLIPKGVVEKGVKIIHVQRNPKDVFVSYFNHLRHRGVDYFTSAFGNYLQLMVGSLGVYQFYPWFKYVLEWEKFTRKHPEQILNLYYEDLKEDPVREIKKINQFLNFNRDDDVIAKIADACSFQSMKKADADVKENPFAPEGSKGRESIMYRKGEVGDWKNWFTVAQSEMVDAWLSENLVDTDLKFRYSLK